MVSHVTARRHGAIVPLTAILIVPLVGMIAFALDIGLTLSVKSDLQNTADASALAGAEKLQDLFVQYYVPQQTTATKTALMYKATTNTHTADCPMYTAEQFALKNKAGTVNISLPDTDVQLGYLTSPANGGTFTTPTPAGKFPNTIQVTTRRKSGTNGSLKLFFASIFGMSTIDLEATARATIYAGDIQSLKPIAGVDATILPVALDINVWRKFYKTGQGPDGQITYGGAGAPFPGTPELKVYTAEFAQQTPGQFGLLNVGDPGGAKAFKDWIQFGETMNDINYLLNNGLVGQKMLPVSPTFVSGDTNNPGPKWWDGQTGLENTLVSYFADVIGEHSVIPVFRPYNAPGNDSVSGGASGNYQALWNPVTNKAPNGTFGDYDVIGFVGVTVSRAEGNGKNNMTISIQPIATIDVTSLIPNALPAGEQNSSLSTADYPVPATTFISAKLTY